MCYESHNCTTQQHHSFDGSDRVLAQQIRRGKLPNTPRITNRYGYRNTGRWSFPIPATKLPIVPASSQLKTVSRVCPRHSGTRAEQPPQGSVPGVMGWCNYLKVGTVHSLRSSEMGTKTEPASAPIVASNGTAHARGGLPKPNLPTTNLSCGPLAIAITASRVSSSGSGDVKG